MKSKAERSKTAVSKAKRSKAARSKSYRSRWLSACISVSCLLSGGSAIASPPSETYADIVDEMAIDTATCEARLAKPTDIAIAFDQVALSAALQIARGIEDPAQRADPLLELGWTTAVWVSLISR